MARYRIYYKEAGQSSRLKSRHLATELGTERVETRQRSDEVRHDLQLTRNLFAVHHLNPQVVHLTAGAVRPARTAGAGMGIAY